LPEIVLLLSPSPCHSQWSGPGSRKL